MPTQYDKINCEDRKSALAARPRPRVGDLRSRVKSSGAIASRLHAASNFFAR